MSRRQVKRLMVLSQTNIEKSEGEESGGNEDKKLNSRTTTAPTATTRNGGRRLAKSVFTAAALLSHSDHSDATDDEDSEAIESEQDSDTSQTDHADRVPVSTDSKKSKQQHHEAVQAHDRARIPVEVGEHGGREEEDGGSDGQGPGTWEALDEDYSVAEHRRSTQKEVVEETERRERASDGVPDQYKHVRKRMRRKDQTKESVIVRSESDGLSDYLCESNLQRNGRNRDPVDDDMLPSSKTVQCPCLSFEKGAFRLPSLSINRGEHRPQQQPHRRLAVQPRGRILGSLSLIKKHWLIPSAVDEGWPRCDHDSCLIMNASEDGGTVFGFEEPRRYTDARQQLIRLINDGLGMEAFVEFLRRCPYHIEGCFVLALISLQGENHEQAFQALRRTLHSFQCSFHPRFSPFCLDEHRSIPWPRVVLESSRSHQALFLSALLLYGHLLSRFGSHTTALEVYKLCYACDPFSDAAHALLHLHHSFLQASSMSASVLHEFCASVLASHSLYIPHLTTPIEFKLSLDLFLPNFAFSVAFKRLRRCSDIPKVAFLNSIDHPDVAPHRYCFLTGRHQREGDKDWDIADSVSPTLCESATHLFFVLDTTGRSSDCSMSGSDHRIGQLLLLRALVVFPRFIRYLLQHLSLSSLTIPPHSRSDLTWHDLLCSPAFAYSDQQMRIEQREKQIVRLATRQLLKLFILKSVKLLGTPSILAFIHECATLLHRQYQSNVSVEASMPFAVEVPKVMNDDSVVLRRCCGSSVSLTVRLAYREVIDGFRSIWLEALIEYCKVHRLKEKYRDASRPEFQLEKLEIPQNLRMSLTYLQTLLGHKALGLGNAYKSPNLWLSLHSSPVLLFFQSLIPYSAIDHQGIRSHPLTWRILFAMIRRRIWF